MLERFYGVLLWLYPRSFRLRYGRQMRDDFAELRQRGGPLRVALVDVLWTVPLEWWGVVRRWQRAENAHASGPIHRIGDALRGLARVLRSLGRRPGFTLVVVVSLGIGIGASTAVFSWTEGLVLRPLPAVGDLSELVTIHVREDGRDSDDPVASYPDFADLREGLADVVRLAGFGFGQFAVSPAADAGIRGSEQVWGAFVTPEYFSLLGIDPLVGRLLQSSDGSATSEHAAFISEALWTRVFGSDPGIVGRALHIDGREFDILGVVGGDFTGTTVGLRLDLWLSVDAAPDLLATAGLLDDRSRRWLRVFGRLEPEMGPVQADRELRALWARLENAHVVDLALSAQVVPLDIGVAARLEPLFMILLGLTGFMLLAVCSNVANLTLMRGAAHDHEVAVMRALGAHPRRVAAMVLTESLILGLLGIAFGLGVAAYGVRLLPALLPPTPLPLNLHAPMDLRVFAFCATLGMAAALLSGAAPALRAMRSDPVTVLRRRGGRTRGSAIQHASLIVVQLALSLGTLVAAGFFFDRLRQLEEIDRGFRDPEHVILFPADLPEADARTAWETGRLEDLVQSVRSLPGVRSASSSSFVPLGFVGYADLEVEVPTGVTLDRQEALRYLVNRVGPGYFDLMGTAIVAGRALDATDAPGSTVAVVVNESFARRHWPGLDPVGRGVTLVGREAVVVGVAADGKYRFDQLDEPAPPFLYVSLAQWPSTSVTLHVRIDRPEALDVAAVRRAFERSFPAGRLVGPVPLDEYTSVALVPVRLGASVLGGLGMLAMVLAALGLYAIMAFRVTQRTPEVGVRLAVGACRSQILALFVRQGATTAAIGMALGLPVVVGIHRVFATLIPGFDPGWETVYILAATTMLGVALAAVTLAARRALLIAPTEALRAE